MAQELITGGLNVREAEEKGRKVKGKKKRTIGKDADTRALEQSLTSQLGLNVSIAFRGEKGGELKVAYKTLEQLAADSLYAGYIERQEADIAAFRKDEGLALPADLDYRSVAGLSAELVQKLERVRPATLGQASRIEGMTPAAVTAVLLNVRIRARQSA
jgi:tRNA U34 5-carboxymethylaminomethyl modifying enzyme MnmG/GidA